MFFQLFCFFHILLLSHLCIATPFEITLSSDLSSFMPLDEQEEYKNIFFNTQENPTALTPLRSILTTLFDTISYGAAEYLGKWKQQHDSSKNIFKPVLKQVIFDSELLLSSILNTSSFANIEEVDKPNLQLTSNMFNDIESLKLYFNNYKRDKKKNWFLRTQFSGLDVFVLRFIRYKTWCLDYFKRELLMKGSRPDLKVVSRIVREIRYSLDSKVATLNLADQKTPAEMTLMVLKVLENLKHPLDSKKEISKLTNPQLSERVKYLGEGAIDIVKGIIWATMCSMIDIHTCVFIVGGLVSIEVLVWVIILGRVLVLEYQ